MRIGSVVLLSQQKCVQSYGWKQFRPLGSLQGVMDSLEEYGCDEVAIIRPVRSADTLDLFKRDIEVIAALKSMTPIGFGGGLRSLEHVNLLKGIPVERVIFSSAFLDRDYQLITLAKNLFGRQAIQCCLPMSVNNDGVNVYHAAKQAYIPLSHIDLQFIDDLANEIIVFDTTQEGQCDQFNWSLLEAIPFPANKLVISGGVGKKTLTQMPPQKNIASILIDNKVLHQEYSISGYKRAAILS